MMKSVPLRDLGVVAVGMVLTSVSGVEVTVTGIIIPSTGNHVTMAKLPNSTDLVLELDHQQYLCAERAWTEIDVRVLAHVAEDEEVFEFGPLSRRATPDFLVLAKPKLRISRAVASAMVEQDVSMRQLAEQIGNMKHPQIHRITSGKNYNIDTLLRVLNGLGLELIIQKKGE